MKVKSLLVTLLLAFVVASSVVVAQRTTIQLGMVLPANSVWDKSLKQMGANWSTATDGRVRLRVLAGANDESTLLRRLKLGRPQAAALGQPGLAQIDDAFSVLGIPFFFESYEEAFYVLEKLTPALTEVLAKEGFVLLNWGHAGWAHFFTADKTDSIDALKQHKIFTSAGDDRMVQWYKQHGFDPQPLALSDVLLGLNTGLINAYPVPPYVALLMQWYSKTPYMLNLPLAPVVGATVVTTRVWDRISPADQEAMLQVAREAQTQLMLDVPLQERESVEQMKKRGLTVVELTSEAEAEFRLEAERLAASWRGTAVPNDIFDLALRERNAYRDSASNAQ